MVSGQIRQRLGPDAFTVGAGELLIVRADDLPAEVDEGDVVQVVGEVRPLTSEEAETDLDEEFFAGLQRRPAIFADGVLPEPAAD